jgi:YidC/Oxa1 family membrane protein insertase
MDRKSITILSITVLLFILWNPLVNKIFPPIPAPRTNAPTMGTNTAEAPLATIGSAESNAVITGATALTNAAPVGKEENVTLETDLARYQFSSAGGGLKLVELKNFKAFVGCNAKKAETNPPATLNKKSPLSMFTIVGAGGLLGDNSFRLSTQGQMVRAERNLSNGVLLVKEFQIVSNYQLKATVRWENHGSNATTIPARQMVFGAATPIGAFDDPMTLGVDWFDGKDAHRNNRTYFNSSSFLGIWNKPAKTEYSGGASNVQWAAAHNQFFTVIVTPTNATPQVAQMVAHPLDLPQPTPDEVRNDSRAPRPPVGILGSFAFADVTIPAGKSFVQDFQVYAGPKEYHTLSRMSKDVDLVMNLDGFWGWFAKVLLLAMNALYAFGASYGWSIVLITIILKIVFYPLTAASTRSMKRMSTLQPQMKALQDKYKDDPAKMQQKLQEFMKEHKINPLGSCLPLLLTIPVFAGFWKMLNSAIELRGASYLWACDLSQPDTLMVIPGINIPINGFALLMIVTMMWQSHMTPPSPGVDPAQQKMMRYMPLIIVPFIYNQAAGLTLYWSVQNLLSILQMKLTKDRPETPAKPARPAGPATPVHRKA